jgi:hypothetical protein
MPSFQASCRSSTLRRHCHITASATATPLHACRLLQQHTHERVVLQLDLEPIPNAATFPHQSLTARLAVVCSPPILRSIHFTRTSGSGSASETLVTALLANTDLSGVWKLRGCEGLAHFWTTCVQSPGVWCCLRSLNLSSCGMAVLPAAVGQLAGLRVLRLNHNKLSSLPPEVRSLSATAASAAAALQGNFTVMFRRFPE